jgi:hypothetical protein
MNKFGYIIETEQNPCGCCPFSLTVTYSKIDFGKGNSVSLGFVDQADIEKYWNNKQDWKELK